MKSITASDNKKPQLNNSSFLIRIKAFFDATINIWYQEYKHIFSDVGVLSVFIAAQLMYPFAYPLPFYKGHEVVREVPVTVIDNDKSSLSRQYLRMTNANENINIIENHTSLEEAKLDFMENKINGIIVIPEGFSSDIYRNQQASVSIYCDASYFYLYKQVYTGMQYVNSYMSAGIQIQRFQSKGMSRPAAAAAREPVPLISYPLCNPSSSYSNYLIPALLMVVLQQTLIIGIGLLGGLSYEQKRYHHFLPSVNSRGGILPVIFGKTGAYMSIFLLHSLYFFSIIFKYHKLPMKTDVFSLMIFIIPFLLATIFMAISISTIFRTREMVMLLLLCAGMPVILLSGFSWPVGSMPVWMKTVAMLLPSTMGIDGIVRLSALGASLNEVASSWIGLWVLTIVYFFIAVFALKKIIRNSTQYLDGNKHEPV